jgi:phage shock protein A
MFSAIGRWLKALGYLLTGQIDASRRTLDTNPHVVRAKYDEIIQEKTARIHQYKQAVAQIIAQEQRKVASLKQLGEEIARLEKLKAGALAKAKQATAQLKAQGKSAEEIKADEDYKKCLAAFNDFSSTLAEKQARVNEIESDVEGYRKTIGDHKVQLQGLLRELEKIKAESSEAVADMITAKQEKDIADTLTGIAQDGTAEELQKMRELRNEVKAEVQISRELAGTDTKRQEEDFLAYAMESQAASEFDALLGLADEAAPAAPETQESALPE